ncbi:MAG: sensor domain-containing diguanylate cyclase [Bacillota bacterium]
MNYLLVTEISISSHIKRDIASLDNAAMLINHKLFDIVHTGLHKMASSPQVKRALTENASTHMSREALKIYKEMTQSLICYVMNREGQVIESTTYDNQAYDFIGDNYSFRPYFKNALNGESTIYPAVGVTSMERGIYFSAPVYDSNGAVLGATVIKISCSEVDSLFANMKGIFFVADKQGIILSSNVKQLLYHYIKPLSPMELKSIEESRQYGENNLLPFIIEYSNNQVLRNGRILCSSKTIENSGWTIGLKNNYTGDFTLDNSEINFIIILNVFVFLLLLFMAYLYLENISKKIAIVEYKTMQQALEQSPASIVITDKYANIKYINKKFIELTGYSFDEAINKNPRILKSGLHSKEYYEDMWKQLTSGRQWVGEFCNRKKNGEFYWESAHISSVKDHKGTITNYIAIKEDITEKKEIEKKLNYYAKHDEMTGLYNRRTGLILISELLQNTKKDGSSFSLFFLDINNLKLVNDTMGHSAGDDLIKSTISIIKKNIRDIDILSRFGGDEFVLVIKGCGEARAMEIWKRIENDIEIVNNGGNKPFLISVSYGLVEYKEDIDNIDDLINMADKRMYENKAKYKKENPNFKKTSTAAQ